MAIDTRTETPKVSVGDYLRNNIREYGLLLALVVIMLLFQFLTNGVLFRPVNITNLVLQNSFIVIMALGMLLIIVSGVAATALRAREVPDSPAEEHA